MTQPPPPDASDSVPAAPAPQFQFVAFAANKISFEHVQRVRPEQGEAKPAQVNYNLVVGAGIKMLPNNQAKVSLGLTVTGDPKWLPYKIEVEVVGKFLAVNSTPEQLDQFCRLGAPPILFPYVRDIVHRVSMDGRFGVVRLNPINIQQLLNMTPWTVGEVKPDATASTSPAPPSEQSPSDVKG